MTKLNVHLDFKNPKQQSSLFLTILIALFASVPAVQAQSGVKKLLPVPFCAEGWTLDGKVTLFDKDTLFDRVNGESELYFPYGFTVLAYARYASKQNPQIAIDADVYSMGSLLDAFGMFANYRKKDSIDIAVGAEGTLSASQVFFYQDRYFVRLQATGTTTLGQDILFACAGAIAKNLPQNKGRPNELDAFQVPAVAKKSERYVAQSLLGYDFFRRGLIAEAVLNSEPVQVFLVPEQSREAAARAFDQYRAYLKTAGSDVRVTEAQGRISLEAIDPLYGNVYVEQAGRFVIGAVRFKSAPAARQIVEQVRARAGKEQGMPGGMGGLGTMH